MTIQTSNQLTFYFLNKFFQFMDFVRKLGKGVDGGEVKGQTMDSKWAGEYVEEKEEEMGYWGQLEKEWQELSK